MSLCCTPDSVSHSAGLGHELRCLRADGGQGSSLSHVWHLWWVPSRLTVTRLTTCAELFSLLVMIPYTLVFQYRRKFTKTTDKSTYFLLHDVRILHTLSVRYGLDMIYTYSSNILIAVRSCAMSGSATYVHLPKVRAPGVHMFPAACTSSR